MHSIISIREYQFAPQTQTRRDPVDITFIVFVVFAMLMMKEMVMKRWPKSRHRSNTIFLCCQKYTFFVMLLLLIYSPFVEAALSSPSSSSSSSSPSSNTYNTSKILATTTAIGAAATAVAAAVTAHDHQDSTAIVMRDIEEGIVYDSGTSMRGKKRGRTYKEDVDKDKRGKKAAVYLGTTSKGVGDEPSSLTPRPAPLGSYPSPLFYDDKSSINSSSTTRGLLPEVANAQPSSSAQLLSCAHTG